MKMKNQTLLGFCLLVLFLGFATTVEAITPINCDINLNDYDNCEDFSKMVESACVGVAVEDNPEVLGRERSIAVTKCNEVYNAFELACFRKHICESCRVSYFTLHPEEPTRPFRCGETVTKKEVVDSAQASTDSKSNTYLINALIDELRKFQKKLAPSKESKDPKR